MKHLINLELFNVLAAFPCSIFMFEILSFLVVGWETLDESLVEIREGIDANTEDHDEDEPEDGWHDAPINRPLRTSRPSSVNFIHEVPETFQLLVDTAKKTHAKTSNRHLK